MNKYNIDDRILQRACTFTNSWIGNAFNSTKSLEAIKYKKLIFKIVNLSLDNKKQIEVNYNEKSFKITNKSLDNLQIKAMEFILSNDTFVSNRINSIIVKKEKLLLKEKEKQHIKEMKTLFSN